MQEMQILMTFMKMGQAQLDTHCQVLAEKHEHLVAHLIQKQKRLVELSTLRLENDE